MAVHGAAAPAHQYASRFLRAARPIARPGAGEHARAARGPIAPRAQRGLQHKNGFVLKPDLWLRTCTDMYLPMEAPAHAA